MPKQTPPKNWARGGGARPGPHLEGVDLALDGDAARATRSVVLVHARLKVPDLGDVLLEGRVDAARGGGKGHRRVSAPVQHPLGAQVAS